MELPIAQITEHLATKDLLTAPTTPPQLIVRSLVPDGLTVCRTSPIATVDAPDGGPTIVEWNVTPTSRRTNFTLYTQGAADLVPGTVLENFFDVSDGLSMSATVSATTTVR